MAEPVTSEQLARLRQLVEAATPGPWGWRGNDDGLVELRGHGPFGRFDGRIVSALRGDPCIVNLDDESVALAYNPCDTCRRAFEEVTRTGVSDAYLDLRCEKPENLGTVWLSGKRAIEPANKWAVRERHYRADVARVDHPDAELIAEARNALPGLLDEIDRLRAEAGGTPDEGPVEAAVVEALMEVGGWDEIDGDGDSASILSDHIRRLPGLLAEAAEPSASLDDYHHRYGSRADRGVE